MPSLRWAAVLWPGLPQLWWQGAWSGLALAGGFAALLDIAILATWVWNELLDPPFRLFAWGGVLLFWLASVVAGAMQLPSLLRVPAPELLADLFAQVQREYLRGNWFECEVAINRLLEQNTRDVDALLMLASLLRRLGHAAEAKQQLRLLATLEGAEKWQLEIAREWQLLRDLPAQPAKAPPDHPTAATHSDAAQNVHQLAPEIATLPDAA